MSLFDAHPLPEGFSVPTALQATVIQHRMLCDITTPLRLFSALRQHSPQAALLESTDGDSRLARFSIIGINPLWRVWVKDGLLCWQNETGQVLEQGRIHDPLHWLEEQRLAWLHNNAIDPECLQHLEGFKGGWLGYVGYNTTQYYEGIPQQHADPLCVPDVYMGFYDVFIVFDHLKRTLTLNSFRGASETELLWEYVQTACQLAHAMPSLDDVQALVPTEIDDLFSPFQTPLSKEAFCQQVEHCKQLIVQGEVFQIVLAQRFHTEVGNLDPLTVYRTLMATNPSPYAYVLQFPEFSYVGSSPETFVQCQNNTVVLRALAGTRRRGRSAEEDAQLAAELKADEKELAEHRMLVDLARNDLGRVCELGSIEVGTLAELHYYTHVMHLATEVKGQRRPDRKAIDVLRSVLPRGTVSGAPKIRAQQHLASLEPERRGIYAGFVGFLDTLGEANTCIAIRSVLMKNGQAHVQAGAGVVMDSVPELEYNETRNKARSVVEALHQAMLCHHVNQAKANPS
ncbi:MAG: anthranilate synthase component I family protein [Vampirovibrionales bacterium]